MWDFAGLIQGTEAVTLGYQKHDRTSVWLEKVSKVGQWAEMALWELQVSFAPPTLSCIWLSFLKGDSLKSPSCCFSLISHPNSGSIHFMPGLLKSMLTGLPNSCSSFYYSNHFTLSF